MAMMITSDDKDGLAGKDGLQLLPAKETSVQSGNEGVFRLRSRQGWQQPLFTQLGRINML